MITPAKAYEANLLKADEGVHNVSYCSDIGDRLLNCRNDYLFNNYSEDAFHDLFNKIIAELLEATFSIEYVIKAIEKSIFTYPWYFCEYYLNPEYNRIVIFSTKARKTEHETVLIVPTHHLDIGQLS